MHFPTFWLSLLCVLPAFLWKFCSFLKQKYFSKYNFVLSGQMSLRIIPELLKNAPVHLIRLEKSFDGFGILPTAFVFVGNLSRYGGPFFSHHF